MAVLVTYGDRLLTTAGRASWLKRPSVPMAQFGRGTIPLSGDQQLLSFLTAYETQPWIAAAVNKLNRGIMDLPLRLYREVTDDGEIEPVRRHEVLDMIQRPWRRGSAADLKQKMCHPALIHGNSVLGKVRDEANGPPVGFVPLDWRFLTAYTLDDGEVFFWETTQPNRPQFWAPEDVIHFAFEAGNGDIGVSPLKQLARTVRMEDSTQRYQSSSFDQGIRPAGALVMPAEQKMKPENIERLRQKLQQSHGGADQAGRMMLLEGGLDWKPFSHTAVEAELIEQRKLNREEAAAVYDVDPPLIGILDHATYSNVEEMHNRFYQATLRPWLTLLSDTLNAQLIAMEPAWADERIFLAFDLSDVLRSDTPEEITAVAAAIAGSLMSPDEGRNRLRMGKSGQKGADKLYIASNNLTVMGADPPAPAAPQLPPADPEIVPEDPDKALERHLERAKRLIGRALGLGEKWDRARFVRELYEDAPSVDGFEVAARLEKLIEESNGSPAQFKRLSDAI